MLKDFLQSWFRTEADKKLEQNYVRLKSMTQSVVGYVHNHSFSPDPISAAVRSVARGFESEDAPNGGIETKIHTSQGNSQ